MEHFGGVSSAEPSKGFLFGEIGCKRARHKVVCCDFSSDGKLLACCGHSKKVDFWNLDTLQTESTLDEHRLVIADVRFKPNSSQLATASFDGSIRLWDAYHPEDCLHAYSDHDSSTISLDYHPKKTDLLCSCNNANEIRYWHIDPFSCVRIFKVSIDAKGRFLPCNLELMDSNCRNNLSTRGGGTTRVRFQPRIGHLLAAANETVVSLFDVETDKQIHSFQSHPELVGHFSWDETGDYLASVSRDSVKVWSITSRACIQEISSKGKLFNSIAFHPSYSTVLVIGGTRTLELWDMAKNKSNILPAHKSIVSDLAQSPVTGIVASASHDFSVKLWK